MSIAVAAGQFPQSFDPQRNLEAMRLLIEQLEADELLILPEGALSGYADRGAFLQNLDPVRLEEAQEELRLLVQRTKTHLIFGSCLCEDGRWFNAGFYYGPRGEEVIYRKINLATHERGVFSAGVELSIFPIHFANRTLQVAIQICREIRFPEQWSYLASQGAELFAYLTNATNPAENLDTWYSHLISRAAENQRFLVSANVAHARQHCPTMIVSPRGEVLQHVVSYETRLLRSIIQPGDISDWYLQQRRTDLIELIYKNPEQPR